MLERLAVSLGLARNLTGIVTVEKTGAELAADPAAAQALLLDACQQALVGDASGRRPRSLVLGGAALTGMGDALAPHLGVTLLDSVRCGLLAAWDLAQSGSASTAAGTTMAAIDWQGEAAGLKALASPAG
jgi:Asp/Glu/hydantoin racemase